MPFCTKFFYCEFAHSKAKLLCSLPYSVSSHICCDSLFNLEVSKSTLYSFYFVLIFPNEINKALKFVSLHNETSF